MIDAKTRRTSFGTPCAHNRPPRVCKSVHGGRAVANSIVCIRCFEAAGPTAASVVSSYKLCDAHQADILSEIVQCLARVVGILR